MTARRRSSCAGAALAVLLTAGACSGDDTGDAAGAVSTSSATQGAAAPESLDDEEMAALGASLLDAAGARTSVRAGESAETELPELARTYCDTARRSDLDNASTTFRYSLSEFFGRHGVVPAVGEPQDATLALAMLAGTWSQALEIAAVEQICPEVR